MNHFNRLSCLLLVTGITSGLAQTAAPYKIVNTATFMGAGGLDFVYADNAGRRLYMPRGAADAAATTARHCSTLSSWAGKTDSNHLIRFIQ